MSNRLLNIDVITNSEDFDQLAGEWNALLKENRKTQFYLSHEWFYAVVHYYRAKRKETLILCVRDQGLLRAVVPLCFEQRRFRLFRYRCIEMLGNIYSPYRGCIGMYGMEPAIAACVAGFLTGELSRQWEMINFEDVPTSDRFVPALLTAMAKKSAYCRSKAQYGTLGIFSANGQTSEGYWRSRSRKCRKNIKNAVNRMHRDGMARVVLVGDRNRKIQSAMTDYERVYANSWKPAEKDPVFHRELAQYLDGTGKLRLFLLYFRQGVHVDQPEDCGAVRPPLCSAAANQQDLSLEGFAPIAAHYWLIHENCAYGLKTCYDAAYGKYSPGAVLMWHVIKYFIDVAQVQTIDFGEGAETYKFQWAEYNESHLQYWCANKHSATARMELWSEDHIIPILRQIKKKVKACLPR